MPHFDNSDMRAALADGAGGLVEIDFIYSARSQDEIRRVVAGVHEILHDHLQNTDLDYEVGAHCELQPDETETRRGGPLYNENCED